MLHSNKSEDSVPEPRLRDEKHHKKISRKRDKKRHKKKHRRHSPTQSEEEKDVGPPIPEGFFER